MESENVTPTNPEVTGSPKSIICQGSNPAVEIDLTNQRGNNASKSADPVEKGNSELPPTDQSSPDGAIAVDKAPPVQISILASSNSEITVNVAPGSENTINASPKCNITGHSSPDCAITDRASSKCEATDHESPNEIATGASPGCETNVCAHELLDSESSVKTSVECENTVKASADCESTAKIPLECENNLNASTDCESTVNVSHIRKTPADSCSLPPTCCSPDVTISEDSLTIDHSFSNPNTSEKPYHASVEFETTTCTDGTSTSASNTPAPIRCTAPPGGRLATDPFNLSSQEGQDHLRELNEELKALNEQGSPKLSMLHSHSANELSARMKRRKRKRRHYHHNKGTNPFKPENSPRQDGSDLSGQSSSAGLTSNPRKMSRHHKVKKRLLDEEAGHESQSPKRLSIVEVSDDDIGDGGSDDSMDEAGIMETANDEIDRILEEKAWKANLSAVNVKNILRYVITNENVLAMVHNSMRTDGDSLEGAFEPKLTRSKAKELMEKRAKVPWPISPLKQPTPSKSKNLSELQFSDSSSDEEYRPELGEISEEEDSFVSSSSPASKAESPARGLVPILSQPSPSIETCLDVAQEILLPQQSLLPKEPCPEELQCTIALRTRSKLPLNDTLLETIEADFVAPDITTDMYDSECDDDEWKDFLGEFLKPLDLNPGEDENNEDPEYNFLEEDDTPDREDLRNDKAVRVSKKELHELMAELIEEAESAEAEECQPARYSPIIYKTHSESCEPQEDVRYTDPSGINDVNDESQLFNSFRRLELEEQMRMHVQLLTQTFVLASSQEPLAAMRESSKSFLVELQCLATHNANLFQRPSSFQAHNLAGAVLLADTFIEPHRITKVSHRVKLHPMTSEEMMAISNSPVFIYPHLLPSGGFRVTNSTKDTFMPAEDCLLAMGLEQFSLLDGFSHWELIREHMLPVKSVSSLACRAKNRKAKSTPDNPIKHYYRFKCAPQVPTVVRHFDPEVVLAPRHQPQHLLPTWLQQPVRRYPEERSKRVAGAEQRLLLPSVIPCIQPIPIVVVPLGPKAEEVSATTQSGIKMDATETPTPFMGNVLNEMVVGPSAGFKTPLKYPPRSPTRFLTPMTPSSSWPPTSPTIVAKHEGHFVAEITGNRCLSMPLLAIGTSPQRPSPLKQVSPILRKYSPKRLKKTGGNLPLAQRSLVHILPKIKIVSPGPRPIAPKVVLQLPQVTSTTPTKVVSVTKMVEPSDEVVECAFLPRLDHDQCGAGSSEVGDSEMELEILDQPKESTLDEDEVNVKKMEAIVSCQSPPSGEVDGFDQSVACDPEAQANDTQESESDPEPDPFDEGDDDTADDDVLDTLPDNEDDLAALMAASTTITAATHRNAAGSRHHRSQHSLSVRKSKNQRNVRKAVLAMLLADEDPLHQERETAFAQSYLQRVREAAGGDGRLFEDFVRHLHEFQQGDMDAVALYRDVCAILKDHPELCDEFVAFLLPEQAMRCGKFVEFLSLTRMQVFLRKLEVHFGRNPQHIHKIVRTLAHVQQMQPQPTMDDLKAAVLPLLRGQQHLVEEFLQLFPHEAPAESRMTEFEEVVVPEDDCPIKVDDDGFEVLELPDRLIDSYGGPNCICRCHVASIEKPITGAMAGTAGKNWLKHCVGCGIRFIDGRVYQQTGKALKPCHVVYLHPAKSGSMDGGNNGCMETGQSPKSVPAEMASPTTGDQHLASPFSSVSSLSPPVSKDSEDERDGQMGTGSRKLIELLGEPDQSDSKSPSLTSQDRSVGGVVSSTDHITIVNITKREVTSHYHSPIENEDVISRISEIKRSKPRRALNFVTTGCSHRTTPAELANEGVVEGVSPMVSQGDISTGAASSLPRGGSPGFDIASPQSPLAEEPPVLSIPESPSGCSAETVEEVTKILVVGGREDSIVVWTREHDRVLLQTCQQLGSGTDAFMTVSSMLQGKSLDQVATRFQELMALFSRDPRRSITAIVTNADHVIGAVSSDDQSVEATSQSRSDDPPNSTSRLVKSEEKNDIENKPVKIVRANLTNNLNESVSPSRRSPSVFPATNKVSEQRFTSLQTNEPPVLSIPETSDVSASTTMPVLAKNRIVDDKGEVVVVWTREHDRVLLQTCQQLGSGHAAFKSVSDKLKDKSVEEVATRFQELMDLFSQQSTKETKCSSTDGVASSRTEEA